MNLKKGSLIVFSLVLFTLLKNTAEACSMYKITAEGRTVVGCNHDTWFTTPRIWFENADGPDEFGAGFTGARQVGGNRTAPQSGMNERGLTFSRLQSFYPKQENPFSGLREILDEVDFLTDILHTCATVQEVRRYIEQYDHSIFIDDVFIYIDCSGNYLIVEPYSFLEGNESNYVLSNFCPSITDMEEARRLERYRNGEDFLRTHRVSSALDYCSALSDTMHVSRSRNGDGTLLTSIWDTKDGTVNLYFYHVYDSTVLFNLSQELAKGDHMMDVSVLFPVNSGFERLKSYRTPYNTPELRLSLVVIAGLLSFIIAVLTFAAFKKEATGITLKNAFLIGALNLLLIGYMFVLATNQYIYYFNAPYRHYSSALISASSYIPFLLLLVVIPISLFTQSRFHSTGTKKWITATLVSNNVIYVGLIFAFGYWGLYSVWN